MEIELSDKEAELVVVLINNLNLTNPKPVLELAYGIKDKIVVSSQIVSEE